MLTFAFVLANIISSLGWVFLASVVVPKVRLYSRLVKWSAVVCFALTAVGSAGLSLTVLFDPEQAVVDQAAAPLVLAVRVGIAISMWLVLTGIWVQVGTYDLAPPEATSGSDT